MSNAFDILGAKDIVTFGIAAYGAILSTVVFFHTVRRERRRVVIQMTTAMYGYPNGATGPLMASFEVINKGHRPVIVAAPGLLTPGGKKLVFTRPGGPDSFPKKLEDGEKAELHVSYEDICQGLKRSGFKGKVGLRPVCTDATGQRYVGKRFKMDADMDWSRLR